MIEFLIAASTGGTAAPAPATVDVLARVLAFAGLAVTLWNYIHTARGKSWKGKAQACVDAREPFEQIRELLASAEQGSQKGMRLWTPVIESEIEAMDKLATIQPDSKLRKYLLRFVGEVEEAKKGGYASEEEQESGKTFSAKQLVAVRKASVTAVLIDERLNVIARKGASGA